MGGGCVLLWYRLRLSSLAILDYENQWTITESGMMVISNDGLVQKANPVAQEILGSDVEGQPLTAVFPTTDAYFSHTLPLHNWRGQVQGQLLIFEQRPLPAPLPPPSDPLPEASPAALSPTIPYRVLRTIGELLEPEAVAYVAVQAIADLTHWPIVAIYTPDDNNKLVIRAAVGVPFSDEGTIGRAFRTGHTQAIPDPSHNTRPFSPFAAPQSALAIPLRRGRKQLGVLLIENDRADAFPDETHLIAEALADAIVLALDNARLFTEAQNRLTEQSVLREAMSIISSTLDLDTILCDLAEQMGQLMNATSVYICSYDAQQATTTVLAEYYGPRASTAERVTDVGTTYYLPDDFPGAAAYLEAGDPLLAHVDDPSLTAVKRHHLQSFDGYTSLVIPLRVGGKTIAYAEIWESQQRRTFTPAEIQLCQDIAHHAAVAIENARLFRTIEDERSQLHALVKSDRDGIILVGANGHILVMNEPACRFLQLDKPLEQWIQASISDTIAHLIQTTPQIAQIAQKERERILQGDTEAHEGNFDLPSHSIHWRSLPVVSEGASPSRLIVLRDITQERLLEKMREDLIHTMVHDLRSPLASMSLTLELINVYMGENIETRVNNALERAKTSTEHMLGMVNAILDISRLESGRLDLAYDRVSFESILQTVLNMQSSLAVENELQIDHNIAPDLPWVQVDAALIERVLQNLIGNAIKFTPAGGVVQIEATVDEDHLLVSISDSGLGIPQEIHGRLFQKFSTGSHPKRGSGLGLAFCKMAIEAHQQRLWLADTSPDGTTFHFTLPLADSNHT